MSVSLTDEFRVLDLAKKDDAELTEFERQFLARVVERWAREQSDEEEASA